MRTLQRAVKSKNAGGEPIPPAFRCFKETDIIVRRSELTLIAGTPGAGKSSLALALVANAKMPTFYLSADTNAHTMSMRMYSMLTGKTQAESEQIISTNPEEVSKLFEAHCSEIRWSFDSTPSLADLDDEIQGFETKFGISPSIIVVDNLMDLAIDGHEEFSGMRQAMKELKYLARDTNAAVIILHHTKEGFNGTPCQPRASVQGMVNQIPALILTIGQEIIDEDNYMCVAPVKNRYGRADASGKTFVRLAFDPASMQLKDITSD
jgi:predicted ATP-dependent serine protease